MSLIKHLIEAYTQDKNRKILYTDNHGKNIVYDDDIYKISVDDVDDATYVILWYNNQRVGTLSVSKTNINDNGRNGKYLSIRSIEIDSKHRNKGYGTKMYKALFDFSNRDIKGLVSYLPNRSNKKQVPKIYKKFDGSSTKETDYQFIDFK